MQLPTNKNAKCYVCGPENTFGLRVPFHQDGAHGSKALYTARAEHGGWNGILHGGVTFALMDEAFGWALYFQGLPAVTARVETRFHKPVVIGTEMTVRAWVIRQQKRIYELQAEVRSSNTEQTLLAEAQATMFLIKQKPEEIHDSAA